MEEEGVERLEKKERREMDKMHNDTNYNEGDSGFQYKKKQEHRLIEKMREEDSQQTTVWEEEEMRGMVQLSNKDKVKRIETKDGKRIWVIKESDGGESNTGLIKELEKMIETTEESEKAEVILHLWQRREEGFSQGNISHTITMNEIVSSQGYTRSDQGEGFRLYCRKGVKIEIRRSDEAQGKATGRKKLIEGGNEEREEKTGTQKRTTRPIERRRNQK